MQVGKFLIPINKDYTIPGDCNFCNDRPARYILHIPNKTGTHLPMELPFCEQCLMDSSLEVINVK